MTTAMCDVSDPRVQIAHNELAPSLPAFPARRHIAGGDGIPHIMYDLTGESARRLEGLGVRVRLVQGLGEGALYFRKRALALVDSDLRNKDGDDALDWIAAQVAIRRASAESRRHHLTPLA